MSGVKAGMRTPHSAPAGRVAGRVAGARRDAGRLQRLRDQNLAPILAAAQASYGDQLPLDRKVLTPASLAGDGAFRVLHDDLRPTR